MSRSFPVKVNAIENRTLSCGDDEVGRPSVDAPREGQPAAIRPASGRQRHRERLRTLLLLGVGQLDLADVELRIVLRTPHIIFLAEYEMPASSNALEPESVHAWKSADLIIDLQGQCREAYRRLDRESRDMRLGELDDRAIRSGGEPSIVHAAGDQPPADDSAPPCVVRGRAIRSDGANK